MRIYNIDNDKVIIQKYGFDTMKDYAIVSGILALAVYFLMTDIPQLYRVVICALLLLGVPVAYYLLRQIQITFDNGEQAVFISYPVIGKRVLIRFSEISHVDFISQSSNFTGFNPYGGYYQIARKKDPLGKGLKILTNVPLEGEEAVQFSLYALPLLQSFVEGNKPAEVRLTDTNTQDFVQEKEQGVYVFRNFRWIPNLLWLALLGLGLFVSWDFVVEGFKEWAEGAVVLLAVILPLFALFASTKTITINKNTNTITSQFAGGVWMKERDLNKFAGFHYERNTTNGIYTGTDLIMTFNENTNLAISSFYRTTKLEKAARELNSVLTINS